MVKGGILIPDRIIRKAQEGNRNHNGKKIVYFQQVERDNPLEKKKKIEASVNSSHGEVSGKLRAPL